MSDNLVTVYHISTPARWDIIRDNSKFAYRTTLWETEEAARNDVFAASFEMDIPVAVLTELRVPESSVAPWDEFPFKDSDVVSAWGTPGRSVELRATTDIPLDAIVRQKQFSTR